ncbi:hypothetical protein [Agromyces badenianii]|uniref:hypothetical protein n=1 Tax=Agromyces badenianii TaxID=2080742 RepID=UPI000D598616|nr:hypothetical protein [Agromyces badenianii]PWC03725.1 hypothetical protein DCE94_12075 [Agromyces badenianii]
MRRIYILLIACAVSIVLYRALDPRFSPTNADQVIDLLWMALALAGGVAVGASLFLASASRAGLAGMVRLGLPTLRTEPRAIVNGLTWAAIALLAVHFTAAAFDGLPGGHRLAGVVLGAAFGIGTFRLHRHAIEHEVYRNFNLVAMLLAAGSLASMSITPTGEWWTHNFSTLGTSNDLAAACFNGAVIVSGLGMAGLSASLTRALAHGPFGLRRGARSVMQTLIALVGVSLMGVGVVPIDSATDLHNMFAIGAAAFFALLCLGVQFFASRMPRSFVFFSYGSLALEVVAMVAYDRLSIFSLTVFEIVAFALMFAWLIALVVATVHEHSDSTADAPAASRCIPRRSSRPILTVHRDRNDAAAIARFGPSVRVTSASRSGSAAVLTSSRRDGQPMCHDVPPRTVRFRSLRPAHPRRGERRSRRVGPIGRVESRHGHRYR